MGTYYLTSKSQLGDNSSLSNLLQPPVILPPGSLAKCEAYCVQAQFAILSTYRLNLSLIVTQ